MSRPGPATSSGLKSSSAVVSAAPSLLLGVTLSAGSAAGTAIVYDNATTNSGLVLAKVACPTGVSIHIPLDGVVALNGLYVAISGTGVEAVVYYERA